jgi:hypothetical protein
MARIRTIKPEFFCHEELFDLEVETKLPLRIAFAGLWTICDREGRFKWRPRAIKAQVLPFDDVDFSRVLHALTTRGFVVKYASNGAEVGHVPGFARHQVVNNREAASVLPEPPETLEIAGDSRVVDACPTRAPRVPHACQGERKGREGKGKEEEGEGKDFCASAAPSHQTKREKYPADFEAFWQAFPAERRRGKPDALKAWKRATDLTEPQTLIDAAKRYAVSPKAKAGFARMPATWLRAEAWTEDEAAWQGGHTPTAGERRQQRNDEVIGKFFGGSDGSEGSFAGLIRDLSGGAE